MKKSDFDIPETTTLLLVGAIGAGKSTLVNNIIRVLNNKTHDFDRAQVCGLLSRLLKSPFALASLLCVFLKLECMVLVRVQVGTPEFLLKGFCL